jgi:hypothetical protein
MNEKSHVLRLGNFLPDKQGWGAEAGRKVRDKLTHWIAGFSGAGVVKLSLSGVKRIDIAFAGEAIVPLAAEQVGKRPFCVIDLADPDLRANLAAAAAQLKVPVMAWHGLEGEALGLRPGSALHQALAFALERGEVRAAQFATKAGVSISNASWRYNRLTAAGLVVRIPGTAKSGGKEHRYRPVS